jgi:hypothetical protein
MLDVTAHLSFIHCQSSSTPKRWDVTMTNRAPWNDSTNEYSPSAEEMDGVFRWLNTLSELARQDDREEAHHVLSSPARMLGYKPTDHVVQEIDKRIAEVTDAYARVLVRNAMEWTDMAAQDELPAGLPSDLFEPLVGLIGRGCQFRLSKGFVEVGDKVIPIHRWPAIS